MKGSLASGENSQVRPEKIHLKLFSAGLNQIEKGAELKPGSAVEPSAAHFLFALTRSKSILTPRIFI